MQATALVIFREILEIAIILSVAMAATVGMPRRGRWIWGGIGVGVLGAALIAAFTEVIAASFADRGQELMNACILLAAAAMIGWTVIWMKIHGREIAQKMRRVGTEVASGTVHARVLAGVVALAVFREGSEIVLFGYGILAGGTAPGQFLFGSLLGFVGGAVVGGMIYLGLIKVSTRHIFTVSSWLLAFVAAGLAAKGVSFLAAAEILPELVSGVWDSSGFLANDSLVGGVLSVLVGYDANPSGIQLLAYLLVLGGIFLVMKLSDRPRRPMISNGSAVAS